MKYKLTRKDYLQILGIAIGVAVAVYILINYIV